jgi:hypothetical protein
MGIKAKRNKGERDDSEMNQGWIKDEEASSSWRIFLIKLKLLKHIKPN